MPYDLETEFKLRATQPIEIARIDALVREAGFECDGIDSKRHLDTYLDDTHGSLAAAGIGLRVREDRRGRRLTCKRHSRQRGALFVREEIELPWLADGLPQNTISLPHALRDLIEPFVLQRPLLATLHLEIERDTRNLRRDEGPVCELAIDRVTTSSLLRTEQFLEVEIEVRDELAACEHLATYLTDKLPLVAASDDKPTHAAHLLGIAVRGLEAGEFSAELPTARVIAQAIHRHMVTIQDAETGVRSDQGPDHLHEMRVALRRLRGLVRAFRELWPQEQALWLLDELAATGRQLGKLRDLDVMLAELPAAITQLPGALQEPARAAATWIQDQRTAEHTALHTWLRSAERLQATEQLLRTLANLSTDTDLAAQPIAASMGPRIGEAANQVRRLIKNLPDELPLAPLHELRIACKRLRYLAEEVAHLPDLAPRKAITTLTRLQNSLGGLCDHEVAAERLLGWIAAIEATPATAAALGGLATRQHLAARKARKRVRDRLDREAGKKLWRRFPSDENKTPF
jgi:triphosphatase